MSTPQHHSPAASPLGRQVALPQHYDSGLLFPLARADNRRALGLDAAALPFVGQDRWQAYELGWLDARGKPVTATATLTVPATSPFLIESKSLKLYLNSLNLHRFASPEHARACIADDLGRAAGAAVVLTFGLPPPEAATAAESLDGLDLAIDHYGPPAPEFLRCAERAPVRESLHSALFKSNCPVTGQPDWAGIRIDYHGAPIERAGLLRYLVSFRNHAAFHEHCVERMFTDILARCRPQQLAVETRFTRRGGLDINPWRATPGTAPPLPQRDVRQ